MRLQVNAYSLAKKRDAMKRVAREVKTKIVKENRRTDTARAANIHTSGVGAGLPKPRDTRHFDGIEGWMALALPWGCGGSWLAFSSLRGSSVPFAVPPALQCCLDCRALQCRRKSVI